MGAIIVKGGRVLGSGVNELKYSRKTGKPWASIHAEEAAILSIIKKPDGLKMVAGSTIFVSRVLANGKTSLAKPCKECQKLIESVGIKKVIHT